MGRRPSIPPHHRILWPPGELARLRDSRVQARSLRRARPPLPPPSSFSSPPRSPAPPAAASDGMPCFLGPASAARGMRYPLRKKLAAARAVVFLPPPEVADAFAPPPAAAAAPDIVAAH